jgi:hypothetical protein
MSKPKPDSVCVVSTDIKSSSKLWSYNDGVWMKNHLLFHHAIITYWAKQHQFNITHNSPEGDAFIMYKKYSNGNKPDYDAILQLQVLFEQYRQNKTLTISEFERGNIFESFQKFNLSPGIYIRVGVAYGPLTEDNFKGYYFTGSSFNTSGSCNKSMTVYRGDLIHKSEKMEETCTTNEIKIHDGELITKVKMHVEHKKYKLPDLQMETMNGVDRLFRKFSTQMIEIKKNATVVFVSFHPGADKDKKALKNKIKKKCQKEDWCQEIKTKRDDSLMLLFTGDGNFKKTCDMFKNAIDGIQSDRTASDSGYEKEILLFNVGISYGNVNITEIPFVYNMDSHIKTTGVCYHKDVFGDPVNLAARAAGLGLPPAFVNNQAIEYFNCMTTNIVVLIPAKKTNSYTSDVAGLTVDELNCATHQPTRQIIRIPGKSGSKKIKIENVIERKIINAGDDGYLYQRVYVFKGDWDNTHLKTCSES